MVVAMMCDLLVAADNAKFSYPEAKLGFTGGMIAGLAARLPHKIAMEIMMLGRTVDAKRAYEVGFVNQIVPKGKQVDEALAMARELATMAPLVLQTIKRFFVNNMLAQGPSEQMGHANRCARHRARQRGYGRESCARLPRKASTGLQRPLRCPGGTWDQDQP